MPGGFHPFHAGHAALYQSALKAFPSSDVYVAATNDTKTRPFPFEIKEKLARVAGVAPGRFVQVTSPFQAKEILQNYNPEEDVVVFVRSEKDRDQQPKPGGTKKDGSPAYFQPYTGKDMQPFGKHGYMAYLPTVEFGPGIKSATEIRNIWPQLNDRRKLAMVMSLYPKAKENQKLAQNIVKMLDLGMGTEEPVNEYNIRKTKKFIQRAHDQEQGQMYGNMPYSSHPKQVANLGKKFFGTRFGPEAVKVALLHDVLEDTPYTPDQLSKRGFSEEVIEAVQLLTKNKALSYADNIRSIINSGNNLAMMVKYSDNYMNYTGDKSHWDADRVAHSQKKYLASLNMLGDVLGIKKHIGDEEMGTEEVAEGIFDRFKKKPSREDFIRQKLAQMSTEELRSQLRDYKGKIPSARASGSLVGGAVSDYANAIQRELDKRAFNNFAEKNPIWDKGMKEGIFDRFKKKPKKPELNLPKFPNSSNANEWMAAKADYYAQYDPEQLAALFSPATGDYLPMSVHVGSSWKPEHLKFYRQLKKKYPDAVAKAKDITTGMAGRVSLSRVGDDEDFYGMTIMNEDFAANYDVLQDLGDGYVLVDDSQDDDDGFVKAGYTVYKKEGVDQYRMVDTVSMSPYSNPAGHIENEIKKIISADQNISESADYLEEK